ncbi:hypothetical protein AB1Y20_004128 [Prymnesium parvum]|uniref:Biogenesis of lysosome-related organelles complex 1 subunit 3 n=1 Tax=Prymnesium parvum TaxID=97485 RepID=A0AB34J5U3_PRYPA
MNHPSGTSSAHANQSIADSLCAAEGSPAVPDGIHTPSKRVRLSDDGTASLVGHSLTTPATVAEPKHESLLEREVNLPPHGGADDSPAEPGLEGDVDPGAASEWHDPAEKVRVISAQVEQAVNTLNAHLQRQQGQLLAQLRIAVQPVVDRIHRKVARIRDLASFEDDAQALLESTASAAWATVTEVGPGGVAPPSLEEAAAM